MIVVDTSVWIDAQRKPHGSNARTLGELLDAGEVALALPVRLQLLMAIAKKDRSDFRRALSSLPLILPTEDTWRLIESWIERASDGGYRFAISDLLIAGLTSELTGLVWSLDRDFAAMEKLGFVRNY